MQYLMLTLMKGFLNMFTYGTVHIRLYLVKLFYCSFFFSDARIYCEAGEDDRHEKDIVRGYTFAEYHADVYDKTECEVTGADLDCECLGGGRIEHRPGDKYIKVDNEFMYHYKLSIIEGLWL